MYGSRCEITPDHTQPGLTSKFNNLLHVTRGSSMRCSKRFTRKVFPLFWKLATQFLERG
jgi:hypothetical protein